MIILHGAHPTAMDGGNAGFAGAETGRAPPCGRLRREKRLSCRFFMAHIRPPWMAGMPVLQERKPAVRYPAGGFAAKNSFHAVFSWRTPDRHGGAGMSVLQERKPAVRHPAGGFAMTTVCPAVHSCEFF
ncbi:hypothetical protein [Stenotrophomonas acidaminiphila]